MKNPIQNGKMIALAAATLFAAACGSKAANTESSTMPSTMGEKTAAIHCMGVNECKGHSACKTEKNACKGQNSCKGQGFLELSADECTAKGGTVAPAM